MRHGQATHNVEGDKNREALLSPHLYDAQLSQLGLQQVNFILFLSLQIQIFILFYVNQCLHVPVSGF